MAREDCLQVESEMKSKTVCKTIKVGYLNCNKNKTLNVVIGRYMLSYRFINPDLN